jgi:urease gamma subunit
MTKTTQATRTCAFVVRVSDRTMLMTIGDVAREKKNRGLKQKRREQ